MQKNQNHASPTPHDHLKVTTNFPLNHNTLILTTLQPIITDIVASFVSIRNKPTFWGAKFWRTLLPKSFAMFNLNENNRFVMAQQPSDMRAGVNKLCGEVRSVGLDPTNGDVYVFVGSSRKLMKLLHWERGGYVMYYKRLEQGRFHPKIFLRQGIGFRSMRWDELVLLMEGISPRVARRRRYQTEVIEQEKDGKITEKSLRKVWLSR